MSNIAHRLVVANYALWADDVVYAKRILAKIPPTQKKIGNVNEQEAEFEPADVFEAAAAALRDRILQTRDENTAKGDEPAKEEVVKNATVGDLEDEVPSIFFASLSSQNRCYRATLWADSTRDFYLKGYPTNVAAILDISYIKSKAALLGWNFDSKLGGGHTWSWRTDESFLTIEIDGWGLLRVQLKWIAESPPSDFSTLRDRLQVVVDVVASATPPNQRGQKSSQK